jgi:hypothetical protein
MEMLMLFLSFPFGDLFCLGLALLVYFLGLKMNFVVPGNNLTFSFEWLILFSSGYFQWFVLIPYLKRKFFNNSKTKTKA